MAKQKEDNEKEPSGFEIFTHYFKEIAGALLLIGFGCALAYFADDISAWFGDMVQNAFNELLRMMGYESPA